MPENPERHREMGVGGSADAGGAGEGEEGGVAGGAENQSDPEQDGTPIGHDADAGERTVPAGDDDSGDPREEDGGEHSAKTRSEVSALAAKAGSTRYPIADVIRALKEAKGDIKIAAAALGMDRKNLRGRIARTPELNALYGEQDNDDVVRPPHEMDTLLRNPKDIPEAEADPKLGLMVMETDKLIRDGLSTLGVPETTIAKLRAFDGLGVGAGRFLAQSMQDTHQIYYINLLKLDAMAEDIKRRYLDPTPEGQTPSCDPLQRMFWQRAYNEIVDQLGKGYDRMLSGTQAMVAMMRAKDGKNQTGNAKAKPGW